jgi:hypothetical protein
MPILSMFYGIVIRMYFYDDKQHHVPHLHAEYAGERSVFNIDNGEVLSGALPPARLAWCRRGSKSIGRSCRRTGNWRCMVRKYSRSSH